MSRHSLHSQLRSQLRVIWTIARKDWRIEGRARDVITATLFFSAIVILILGLAFGPEQERLRDAAPGILWIAIAFASILAASRAFAAEAEDGALEALLLYPVPHELIYLGKWWANFVLMLTLSLIIAPLVIFIYGIHLSNILLFALTVLLGVAGFSLVATFYSALTVNLRARESLLPVLIFPLIVPVVLGSVQATSLIVIGATGAGLDGVTTGPGSELLRWLQLLLGFDVIYAIACTLVFPFAVEN